MITVDDLTKTFKSGGGGTVVALDNVNLTLQAGHVRLHRGDVGERQVHAAEPARWASTGPRRARSASTTR